MAAPGIVSARVTSWVVVNAPPAGDIVGTGAEPPTVNATVATVLGVYPVSMAIAETWVETVKASGVWYCAEKAVGKVPSIV